MRGFDFDNFLLGTCRPIIAGEVHFEARKWRASIFAHNMIEARCLHLESDRQEVVEHERQNAILQLMRRGADVRVCETKTDFGEAVKLFPANIIEWAKTCDTKNVARMNCDVCG